MAADEHGVDGHRLHEAPVGGRDNKFVITPNEAWFLPFEDNGRVPMLCEILAEVVDISRETTEREFEEGGILVGYIAKQRREISIHNWPLDSGGDSEAVKKRVREVFPNAKHFVGVDGEKYEL
jgi:hypothetical protein